jgi:hypothetical protein
MGKSLEMRLSEAGLRQQPTKLIYPNHRSPPWLTEDVPRDRSNRLLGHALEVWHAPLSFNGKRSVEINFLAPNVGLRNSPDAVIFT